jgi:hypothetical protein
MKAKVFFTQETVRSALLYNPDTGLFCWPPYNADYLNKRAAGKAAGTADSHGRIIITLERKRTQASRLAWIYEYGELSDDDQIDHINGDPADNRICNLRIATHSQNCANSVGYSKRGYPKGIEKVGHKYRARIMVNRRVRHLGYFFTEAEAIDAHRKASNEVWGEFAKSA